LVQYVKRIEKQFPEQEHLISLGVIYDSIFTRVIFMPTSWVTESTYKFIDKNKLECVLTGDGNGTLIYKKIK